MLSQRFQTLSASMNAKIDLTPNLARRIVNIFSPSFTSFVSPRPTETTMCAIYHNIAKNSLSPRFVLGMSDSMKSSTHSRRSSGYLSRRDSLNLSTMVIAKTFGLFKVVNSWKSLFYQVWPDSTQDLLNEWEWRSRKWMLISLLGSSLQNLSAALNKPTCSSLVERRIHDQIIFLKLASFKIFTLRVNVGSLDLKRIGLWARAHQTLRF